MTATIPYNGQHILAELHDASGLADAAWIEHALRAAADAAHATVIDVRLHAFGPGKGITGVALLAESHISIHSWPEHRYAAIDIFLCGDRCDPEAALATIARHLDARVENYRIIPRGYGVGTSADGES